MLTIKGRALAAVAAAAIALTTFNMTPAEAGTRRGDAAALAAIAGLFGTVAAIAAANAHDDYRPYYGAPHYGAPVYRGPVHPGHRWSGWHRHHRYR